MLRYIREEEKDYQESVQEKKEKFCNKQDFEAMIKETLNNKLHVFYCVKFENGKKLNSHLWFFKGFCELFNPDYCLLLDCGLEPAPDALWQFFAAMEVFAFSSSPELLPPPLKKTFLHSSAWPR